METLAFPSVKFMVQLTRVEVLGTEFNLFPLYHPASIIYNVKLKEIYNEDLNKLRMIIG